MRSDFRDNARVERFAVAVADDDFTADTGDLRLEDGEAVREVRPWFDRGENDGERNRFGDERYRGGPTEISRLLNCRSTASPMIPRVSALHRSQLGSVTQ